MHGYETIFSFGKGLAEDALVDYQNKNTALSECFNLRPYGDYLTPYKQQTRTSDLFDYPFPVVWQGNRFKFTVTAKEVTVSRDGGLSEKLLDNNGQFFDFVDFNDFVLGLSKSFVIYYDCVSEKFQVTQGSIKIPTGNCLTNYNGQLFIGGFKQAAMTNSIANACWSAIGLADFTLDLSNEAGFTVFPSTREVYKIKQMADSLYIYTNSGIFSAKAVGLAYGFYKINGLVLFNANCVNGDTNLHIALTNKGLVRLTKEKVELLEFSWLLTKLNKESTQILFDERETLFYITDGKFCFCLSDLGLFETDQKLSCLIPSDNSFVGKPMSSLGKASTLWNDFGRSGFKTIETVDLDGLHLPDACLVLYWYNKEDEIFHKRFYFKQRNTVFPIITARFFKFSIEFKINNNTQLLRKLRIRYKYVDRSSFRATTTVNDGESNAV